MTKCIFTYKLLTMIEETSISGSYLVFQTHQRITTHLCLIPYIALPNSTQNILLILFDFSNVCAFRIPCFHFCFDQGEVWPPFFFKSKIPPGAP